MGYTAKGWQWSNWLAFAYKFGSFGFLGKSAYGWFAWHIVLKETVWRNVLLKNQRDIFEKEKKKYLFTS